MKDRLIFNSKIEMRRSPIHGWGVFAKYDIQSNEILEEVPFLILPIAKGETSSLFIDYRFNFPCGDWKYQVLPAGFSCYYNHSNNPNAGWYSDDENEIFVFTTSRFIKKDEEIFTYYGDVNYWSDGRTNTKVL
jgi:SET domain-containing protein